MNIVCLPVEKTVHRAWLRKPVARDAFDLFREGLKRLFDRIDQGDADERIFSAALELCITWINRVLFLKLLEGRLVA